MSLNLSAHLQKQSQAQRHSSTITNQVIVNPSPSSSASTSPASATPGRFSEAADTVPLANYPSLTPPSALPSAPPMTVDVITPFKLKLLEILQSLFSHELALLHNIIEPSKNIILTVEDLYALICILCDTNSVDIVSAPVIKGCSCADKVLYAQIERIVVNGFDLMIAYNSAFNTLRSNHISLEHVIPSSHAL
jgi:hypothetical protein